jgi:hypothetical protein
LVFILLLYAWLCSGYEPAGCQFQFKQREFSLTYPIRHSKTAFIQRGGLSAAQLDTLSNFYDQSAHWVEIIRQDHPTAPTFGLALRFEFDENGGEFPYTPARAVAQFKDFRWGGVEFSATDSLNYTGVSNDVSDDLTLEIDRFESDTIYGHFSGLLLNGAGGMSTLESGSFKVRLYRINVPD